MSCNCQKKPTGCWVLEAYKPFSYSESWWQLHGTFSHFELDGTTLRRSKHQPVDGFVVFHGKASQQFFTSGFRVLDNGFGTDSLLISKLHFIPDTESNLILGGVVRHVIADHVLEIGEHVLRLSLDILPTRRSVPWGSIIGGAVLAENEPDVWESLPVQVLPVGNLCMTWKHLSNRKNDLQIAADYGVPPEKVFSFLEELARSRELDEMPQQESGLDGYGYSRKSRQKTYVEEFLSMTAHRYSGGGGVERCGGCNFCVCEKGE